MQVNRGSNSALICFKESTSCGVIMPKKKGTFRFFYDAWWFLNNHPMFLDKSMDQGKPDNHYLWFSRFKDCLDIYIVKVNPETDRIEDNHTLNTETEIWLECGPWRKMKVIGHEDSPKAPKEWTSTHDINLDCGGATFEDAIVALANLVIKDKHYGNKTVDYYDKGEIHEYKYGGKE